MSEGGIDVIIKMGVKHCILKSSGLKPGAHTLAKMGQLGSPWESCHARRKSDMNGKIAIRDPS